MSRTTVAKLGRLAGRALARRPGGAAALNPGFFGLARHGPAPKPTIMASAFISSSARLARPVPAEDLPNIKEANISEAEYHQLADTYLEGVLEKFEAVADKAGMLDIEYSAGVMNINVPTDGTWVLNKQPPNKQIWLSSPKSGPKRFNWVVISEDQQSKQDTATGGWVYLKDGTFLNEILYAELGVNVDTIMDESSLE